MRRWWPLLAISLGTFMLLIDVTIVNVALPSMAADLRTSFSDLQWVIDGYALVLAALLLAAGSVADRVGHRRTYLVGLLAFAAASLASGVAPNAGALVAARAVQGVGAAAMFATTFALLNASYQGRDRGTAYGIWGATNGIAAAAGPILGGVLTEHLNWRWIFFVNLPLCALTVTLVLLVIRADHGRTDMPRLDLPGILAFTVSAATLTYGLIRANEHGWTEPLTVGCFVVAALALVVFVVGQRRAAEPMFDLRLLGNPQFVAALLGGLMMTFCAFAYLAYASIWLQSILGLSPVAAGLAGGLPMAGAAFLTSAALGRFLHGSLVGKAIAAGLLLIGVGSVIVALQLHGAASWPALTAGLIVAGVGVGLAAPTVGSSAMAAVPLRRGGMAAGAANTARQLGFALGIAVLGTVFASGVTHSLRSSGVADAARLGRAVAGGQADRVLATAPAPARPALQHTLDVAAVSGLRGTVIVAGLCALLAGVVVAGLYRRAERMAARVAAGALAVSG